MPAFEWIPLLCFIAFHFAEALLAALGNKAATIIGGVLVVIKKLQNLYL
jgi:hypothetical protein